MTARVEVLATLERLAMQSGKGKALFDAALDAADVLRDRWGLPECDDHSSVSEDDQCAECGAFGDAS